MIPRGFSRRDFARFSSFSFKNSQPRRKLVCNIHRGQAIVTRDGQERQNKIIRSLLL